MSETQFNRAGVEIWRGGVTPWQCDEMGHMNVRFYLAIATEGLAGLAAALGMPRAFTPGATSTLLVREHHVRFLKEARPGAGLLMMGGVLSMGETDAVILQQLFHASGEPAAAPNRARHPRHAPGPAPVPPGPSRCGPPPRPSWSKPRNSPSPKGLSGEPVTAHPGPASRRPRRWG